MPLEKSWSDYYGDGSSSGGGDATLENQQAILAKLSRPIKVFANPQRPEHIQIIRGDAYDGPETGKSHAKFSWDFGKDITGKTFTFTIRGKNDTKDDTPLLQVTGVGVGQLAEPVITSVHTVNLPLAIDKGDWHKFDIQVENDTDSNQSQLGSCQVLEDVT